MNRGIFASLVKKKTSAASNALIGTETVFTAAKEHTSKGREECFQYTAKKTGTVTEISLPTSSEQATGGEKAVKELVIGIRSDEAGKPKGGAGGDLGHGTLIPAGGELAASTTYTLKGLSVPVTAGTPYWLCFLPLGGSEAKIFYETAANGTPAFESKFSLGNLTEWNQATEFETSSGAPGEATIYGKGGEGTTESGAVVLPGAQVIPLGTPEADWKRAAEAGCKVGRLEEDQESLANALNFAAKAGMKLCFIFIETKSYKALFEEWNGLGATQKNALLCVEYKNESWPGGVGSQLNGKEYGLKFIARAKEQRELKWNVPLLMQTRLAKDIGTSWMDQLAEVNHTELKKALEPEPEGKTGFLPTGNWLASHPYFNKANLAQKEPNNLGPKGATTAYNDTSNNEWGFQRWMKEQQYIKNVTGLTVPTAITEYGVRWSGNFGEFNSVGSHEKQAEYAEILWAWMKLLEEGKVTTGPTGLAPSCPFVIWYDQYSHRVANAETFGFYYYAEEGKSIEKNESASFFKRFKEGAERL